MPAGSALLPEGSTRRSNLIDLFATDLRPWLVIASAMSLLCLLLVPFPLGFDPNAWVTWATAIGHGDSIRFMIEPGWKPLPVLLMAPFAAVSVNLAAAAWMFIVRFCAFLIPILVFRLVTPTFGRSAAVLSALAPLTIPVVWILTADGHSEPVMVACELAAFGLLRAGRKRPAIALATVVCLLRPEAIAVLAAFGVWCLLKRDREGAMLLLVVAACFAAAWFGAPWFFGSDAFQVLTTSRVTPPLRHAAAPLENLLVPTHEALWPPRWLAAPLILAGAVALGRARDRTIELMLAAVVAHAAIAAIELAGGAAGDQRYFLALSVSMCCLVGPGAMLLIGLIRSTRARAAVTVYVGLLLIAATPLRGFPLRGMTPKIPGPALARSLDAGAEAMRIALATKGSSTCISIGVNYDSWPALAARTEHPMGESTYIAQAPAIAVDHSRTGARRGRGLQIRGASGKPRLLHRSTVGHDTWTVRYYPGAEGCGRLRGAN